MIARCRYIDYHLSQTEASRPYWRHHVPYWNLLYQYMRIGAPEVRTLSLSVIFYLHISVFFVCLTFRQRKYLSSRCVLFWLIDYYMGEFSPYNPPVRTITFSLSLLPLSLYIALPLIFY